MLNHIEQAISQDDLIYIQTRLAQADWVDGRVTAGSQSGSVKYNSQLPEHSALAVELGNVILKALGQHPVFLSAALPLQIFPPLFNRYGPGQRFGTHVDNAIRPITGTRQLIRTDLSATLFLAEPDSYTGGELQIETEFGGQTIKLKAGDMVLYPSTSLHRVHEITQGTRVASFFWIQSMVRDAQHRSLLHELDKSIQSLTDSLGQTHTEVIRLTGLYHNLLRQWSEL